MRRLPARFNAVAMPFVLSIIMSCIVAGISTVKNVGVAEGYWNAFAACVARGVPVIPGVPTAADVVGKWMSAWAWSWAIAFPTLLVVLPIVRRICALFVEPPGGQGRPS